MKMPPWLRAKVSTKIKLEIKIKMSIILRLSPHVIGWTILIGYYVLTHSQGHLPVG